jgi:hypothetical protein
VSDQSSHPILCRCRSILRSVDATDKERAEALINLVEYAAIHQNESVHRKIRAILEEAKENPNLTDEFRIAAGKGLDQQLFEWLLE